eukprot:CAMPEP_0168744078 /NCGR_PEP_ID=MMETSP0724-20121128/13905_1 /TAXON_ID=265536 /ORGANISM="Amphiprora sp., Strain CCMP467" /LENGTH=109 /DNA_ID=CAMNT_0008791725 /DNA_START=85 /DNA_END=414 /DNA_ORIENTATION=+
MTRMSQKKKQLKRVPPPMKEVRVGDQADDHRKPASKAAAAAPEMALRCSNKSTETAATTKSSDSSKSRQDRTDAALRSSETTLDSLDAGLQELILSQVPEVTEAMFMAD